MNVISLSRSALTLATFSYAMVLASSVLAESLVWDEIAVKARCEAEWPTDFAMQAYCVRQNKQGFDAYEQRRANMGDTRLQPAFANCENEWDLQWDMVNYCARQQEEALEKFPTILAELPEGVAEVIKTNCETQWSNDYSMIAYCVEQNANSWRELNQ